MWRNIDSLSINNYLHYREYKGLTLPSIPCHMPLPGMVRRGENTMAQSVTLEGKTYEVVVDEDGKRAVMVHVRKYLWRMANARLTEAVLASFDTEVMRPSSIRIVYEQPPKRNGS